MSITEVDQLELLGTARPDEATLAELVRAATGDPGATPLTAYAEHVPYQMGTPSTAALLRVRGTARRTDGSTIDWSAFVKRLQSVRHWEHLELIPEQFREDFIANVPWRMEMAVLESDVAALLPEGMRLPVAYRVDEEEDERATVWMENVAESTEPWELPRFERAAYLLGRLAAKRQPHLVEPFLPRPGVTTPGVGLRYYVSGRVMMNALPALADDATWEHPLLHAAVCRNGEHQLRADLLRLGRRVPEVVDALDRLPQTYQHGDASPQNLLVPAGEPDTFVVIDWGFDCPQAVGFDLGQLLIGLGHAGILEADQLRAVHEVIVDAFTEGLNTDGHVAEVEQVRYGYLGSMMLRSAFTALPLELIGMPPSEELATLFDQRVRLTRFMVDLIRELR
jgi:Phosphotransferase enzyme family